MLSLKGKGAGWREVLKMDVRVLPETVTKNAKTRAGIQQMLAEIEKAEADVETQHKYLNMKFHPDKNPGVDTKPVRDTYEEAYEKSQKEFKRAKEWLEAQRNTVPD